MKEPSVKRLHWQCRRGMLELDLLLISFVENQLNGLDSAEYLAFGRLLEYPDHVLLDILMGRMAPTDSEIAHVVNQIRGTYLPST